MKAIRVGRPVVGEGNEDEFVRRWTQFLRRSKAEAPGLIEGNGSETRRTRATSSFSEWTDEASRTNRRILDDFQSHPEAAGCVCDAFSHDYELATEVK